MKIVIIGAAGQLGSDLMDAFAKDAPIALDRKLFDIEEPTAMAKMLVQYEPELVINTAAFHNVELCETRPDRAMAINGLAVDALAMQCASAGATFAHVSTDYVFGGEADRPYRETDATNPINAYGISKLAGELFVRRASPKHFIFRTSGLYGIRGSSTKGYTFIERMLENAAAGKPLRVVDDVTFSPSYTRHVARTIAGVVATNAYGTYHVTNAGACTWFEFASEIFQQAGLAPDLSRTTQDAFPSLARRPRYSALAHAALETLRTENVPTWQDGVREYLSERDAKRAIAPRSLSAPTAPAE